MAQRIVRGKAKIRDEQIPYVVPSLEDLPERLDAVLSAIYLVFNEGYAASQGDSLLRVDLTAEAIRLGRLLVELLPDPEAKGLLALMLLHESRREARASEDGEIILLEEQDRSRWDDRMISEGKALVEQALRSRTVWCVHAPGCHFGNSCPGRHRRPDGLESDCRALLGAPANRFIAGRRTQSGRRGRDAGRTGGGAGPDRCDSQTRGPGGLSPCPRGASGVVPSLRKDVRREGFVCASTLVGSAGTRAAILDSATVRNLILARNFSREMRGQPILCPKFWRPLSIVEILVRLLVKVGK